MTMNDWRAELRLELEKLVDAAVVAGARQRDVYAAILDEIGRFGSPTNETLIPPTTSRAGHRRTVQQLARRRLRVNGLRMVRHGVPVARVYEVGDRDLTQQHAADLLKFGIPAAACLISYSCARPVPPSFGLEALPAPRTRRCSHLWDKHGWGLRLPALTTRSATLSAPTSAPTKPAASTPRDLALPPKLKMYLNRLLRALRAAS